MNSDLLRIEEAASYLGVNVQTLRAWKRKGNGPRYIRFGGKLVYPVREIQVWLDGLLVDPAAGEACAKKSL